MNYDFCPSRTLKQANMLKIVEIKGASNRVGKCRSYCSMTVRGFFAHIIGRLQVKPSF